MTDIKDMTEEPDETEKLMQEKNIDRETAWSIIQERKEQEMIKQKHAEQEPKEDEGFIAECSGCHNKFQVSGSCALNVITGGQDCPNCGGNIDIIIAEPPQGEHYKRPIGDKGPGCYNVTQEQIQNLYDKFNKGELINPKTNKVITNTDEVLIPISYTDIDAPLETDKCITLSEALEEIDIQERTYAKGITIPDMDYNKLNIGIEDTVIFLNDVVSIPDEPDKCLVLSTDDLPTDEEHEIFRKNYSYPIIQVQKTVGIDTFAEWIQKKYIKITDIKKDHPKNLILTDRFTDMDNKTAKTIQNLDITLNIKDYFRENENTGKQRLVISELARDIIYTKDGINRGILLLSDNKKIVWYNGQHWQEDGEELLKDKMQKILGEHTCTRHLSELINWVKNCRNIHITRDEFDAKTNLIGLQNGVFNLDTYTLEDFTPGSLITLPLNIEYDAKAKCPVFNQFIDDVLYEEDKEVIQEMAGFILDKSNPIAALFMLVGYGRNGKSTLLNTLIAMLGKQNISSVPIQSIADENFSRIDLYRKYANIVNDLTSKELKNTALIKMLTGHDPVRARDLYEKSMLFYNTAKLISAMNEIPTCDDKSTAWAERVKVVEFPNQFLAGDPKTDQYLLDKLTTPQELSGIFNWAIEGLKRLRKNKKFSPCKTLEDVAKFIKENKNPVYQFVKQRVKASPQASWVKEDAYKKFLEFAIEKNFPTMGKSPFGENLKRYLTELNIPYRDGQSKEHGRVWYDIEFCNPDAPPEGKPPEDTPTITQEKIDFNSDGNENIDDLPEYTDLEIASGVDKLKNKNPNDIQKEVDNE